MRAFIGLELSTESRAFLTQHYAALKPRTPKIRWLAPESLHLTLKFLGDITADQRKEVELRLQSVARGNAPLTLQLGGLGAFPSAGAPRIIWVGLKQGEAEVTALASAVEEACRVAGLAAEERPFSAHITIGRVLSPKEGNEALKQLSAIIQQWPDAWEATDLHVYESRLSSEGARYSVLATFGLGASAGG